MARARQYRYLSNYIDPTTGRERLGSGADSQCFHYYANVENVIKFGLQNGAFPPGQYNIYSWPSGYEPRFIRVAYKRA